MPNTKTPDILQILTALSLGEITLVQAAVELDSTVDDLAEFIEANPALVEQADARAQAQRTDPRRTIERSHAGLASAVEHLSNRIQTEGGEMAVAELVQGAKTLESLVGFAKAQEMALKSNQTDTQKYPLLIQDRRTGGKVRIFLVPTDSPMWLDTSVPEHQAPVFSWLETFAPIGADGEILRVEELLGGHVRVMTETGLVLGGA